jgi:ribosomal protein S14
MLFKKTKDLQYRNSYNIREKNIKLKKFVFINLLTTMRLIKNLDNSQILGGFFNNRCVHTNRRNVSLKSYRTSRIFFRELLQFGVIPGFKKAVW